MTFSYKNSISTDQFSETPSDKAITKFKKPSQKLLERVAKGHYRNIASDDTYESQRFSEKLMKVMSEETQAQKRARQLHKNRKYNSNQKWTENVLNGIETDISYTFPPL